MRKSSTSSTAWTRRADSVEGGDGLDEVRQGVALAGVEVGGEVEAPRPLGRQAVKAGEVGLPAAVQEGVRELTGGYQGALAVVVRIEAQYGRRSDR